MALVIRPQSERLEEVAPQNGKRFTLAEVQEYVGGYAEIVARGPAGEVMYADEDGLMRQLPQNLKATAMAGKLIVGPVLVVPSREDMR